MVARGAERWRKSRAAGMWCKEHKCPFHHTSESQIASTIAAALRVSNCRPHSQLVPNLGTAHCALAPLPLSKLEVQNLTSRQLSRSLLHSPFWFKHEGAVL